MKLIPQWRNAPKMLSVQCMAAIASLQTLSVALAAAWPDALASAVPGLGLTLGAVLNGLSAWLAIGGIAGRIIDQGLSAIPEPEPKERVRDSLMAPTEFQERGQ